MNLTPPEPAPHRTASNQHLRRHAHTIATGAFAAALGLGGLVTVEIGAAPANADTTEPVINCSTNANIFSTNTQGVTQTIAVLNNDTSGSDPSNPLDPSTLTLIDNDGTPTDTIIVRGKGTYTVSDGKVVFIPEPDFTGTATPVTYRVSNESEDPVTATATPTVTPTINPTHTPSPGSDTAQTGTAPTAPAGTASTSTALAAGVRVNTSGATTGAETSSWPPIGTLGFGLVLAATAFLLRRKRRI